MVDQDQLTALDAAIAHDRTLRDRAWAVGHDGEYRWHEREVENLLTLRELVARSLLG